MEQHKYLYLLRHAKSSWEQPHLSDFERPLNPRGEHDAPLMAQHLAAKTPKPELIVSSPATRALRTATFMAAALQYPADHIRREQRIYEASTPTLLQIVQSFDEGHACILLVGHNPGFTGLCNLLCDIQLDNLPTCGLLRVDLGLRQWREVRPGAGRMMDLDYPKKKAR